MNEVIFLYFIVHIVAGLLAFFLGLFVFIKRRNKLNFFFFLFYSLVALWAFSYAVWLIAQTENQALFFARTLNFFAVFIPVLYLEWLLRYLNLYKIKKILPLYITTIGFILFSYNNSFVTGVIQINIFNFFPQSGWLHKIFLVQWTSVVLYSYIILYLKYKSEKNFGKKRQILFILWGTIFGFIGGSFNYLLMLNIDILPIGSLLVSFFPLLVAYAMLKHNLMNVQMAMMQALLLIMNIAGIVLVFMSDSYVRLIITSLFVIIVLFVSFVLIRNYSIEMNQKKKLIKLSKDLEHANRELKRLDNAKSEFISIASHQLRTPLTAIKGYISLILEGAYGQNSPKTVEALNKIFLANERLIQLVEDLLNITHIEAGRLEYHMDNIHLEEILEELYDMFTLRARDKGLDFVLDLPDEQLPVLKADKSKLREVISNLIDNAIKYTKKGFVHISVKYDRRTLRIIVEDSGVGISPESMKTLFAKFSRGTDSSKVYTEGTGLGLFVGKNLIESQGGHIYAESDGTNKGSRFIIEMPLKKVND